MNREDVSNKTQAYNRIYKTELILRKKNQTNTMKPYWGGERETHKKSVTLIKQII